MGVRVGRGVAALLAGLMRLSLSLTVPYNAAPGQQGGDAAPAKARPRPAAMPPRPAARALRTLWLTGFFVGVCMREYLQPAAP